VSKREDDLPDMESGMTTAERRRRRRRGGLRVPSDNVPRRTGSHPAVAAPVPEDPNLAVSIAYSFSTDGSAPMARADEPSAPVRADESSAPVRADGVRVDGVPEAVPENGSSRAAAASGAHVASAPVDAPATLDPDVAAEIQAGIVDDDDDDEPEMTIEPGDDDGVVIAADGTPVPTDDVVFDGKTREMPAMNLEALGLSVGDGEPSAREVEPEAAPAEPTAAAPAPEAPPVEAAPAAPSVPLTSVDIELDEEPEAVPISRSFRRTTTVALSEEDLEELMDAEAEAAARAAAAAEARSEARSEAAPHAPARAATPDLDAEPLGDEDLKEEVQIPADAADSGEILTEDLIEEVDAQSAPVVAAAAPAAAAAPVAAAAEGAAPAEAAHAPPTPPPVAVKPPPAPRKAAAARAAAVAAAATSGAEGKKRKKGKPWFEDIFDEDYLRTLPFLTPQATQQEARFVIESLGLEAGAQVLDLGCGYGRHAMELAARGFHVVGLDLSLPLLLRGADEAQRRGLTINFVHGDMRELDFDSQFDGAYCLFSTFGFFDDETNKKTAQHLARALKPGARAVIEILNRDYLIGDLPTRVWWEGDGCVVLEEVEFNYFSSRIQSSRSVVFDDGRQLEQEISIRAYSLHELGKLLHSCGFRVIEVSGAIQTRGRFFGSHSRHIMVVAERRPGRDPTEITKG
jgi:SAM-dependent methyltransferase